MFGGKTSWPNSETRKVQKNLTEKLANIFYFLKNEDLNPKFEKHKRIVLFEKAKGLLPHDIFEVLQQKLKNQGITIRKILSKDYQS